MVQKKRRWIGVAVLLCMFGAASFLLAHHHRGHHPVRPGEPLPQLSLVALDGASVKLGRERSGTVIYNVFTTWCPSCREEAPALSRVAAELHKRGIRFVGIDQGEGTSAVATFANTFNVGYPIVIDQSRETNALLGARVIPETLVVRDGIVRAINVGPLDAATLQELIAQSEDKNHA